jgi:threonine dehydrogenase-like Zn-dependent dehydrogenase
MKAIVINGPEECSLAVVTPAPLKNHELKIKVKASCVCGSDLKNFKNPVKTPQIPGHEFSGIVTEIGPNTLEKIKIGDRVTAFPMMGCMKCEACLSQRFRDCNDKLSLGFQIPGSFSEYVTVDERFVVHLNPTLSFEEGALVEHLCCGHRLAKEVQAMQPNLQSHIVVIGDGPIALADIQALLAYGYTNITLVGKHPFRMNLATQLGATNVIKNWNDSPSHIDICIHAAVAPETMKTLSNNMNSDSIIFPQTSLVKEYPQFKIGRAFAYSLIDFYEVMALIENKSYKTEKLITQRVSLKDFPKIFPTLLHKGNHFKTVIIP